MLKKKKGFNIATKSAQSKLLRDGFDLLETKTAFNEVVAFYFALVNTHPEGIDLSASQEGGWRYYELLTLGDEARYVFPFNGFPALLRRSAIRRAIGAWSSWHSNYLRWLSRPQKHKHHRPPVQPRHFNFSPSYDAGVWKEDDGESIIIKILVSGQWKWVKFFYQSPPIDVDWVKGSPSIVCKGKNVYITWTLAKYIPATGGIKKVMAADSNRVCSVDTDLDRHIAICTILETEGNGKVSEVARLFINQRNHVKLRKRDLGLIASKMQQTGIIDKGFAKKRWQRLHNREVSSGRSYARQITEFALAWGCTVIAFEHLGNLKPVKGKYSRRSNQKRAYWLKSRVYQGTKQIAYQDYGILTTRVNPKNTSRLDPWGNRVWRSNQFPSNLFDFQNYQPGANFVGTVNGYIAHSGLNAARNIGLKAIWRHRTNFTFRGRYKVAFSRSVEESLE
jgi:hypothetical protein